MRKTLLILAMLLAIACPAAGRSLRQHQLFIVDEFGDAVTDITSVTIYNVDTTTATTIYTNRAGDANMANPLTTSSTLSSFQQSLGLATWFQSAPNYKVTLTDGTKVLTIDNRTETDTRFPWYSNYIGTLTSLSVGDNNELVFGSDSDVVASWENANNILSWIPKTDGVAFDIGDTDATKQMDFNVYVGGIAGGGLSINEGTSAFAWLSSGAFTVNATGAGTTAFHGAGTGTIAIGSGTSGNWSVDGTGSGTINADDSIAITVSAGTIGIASTGGDLTIDATDKSVIIRGTEAIADAIWVDADAGGVDITSAATFDIDITATGGKILATASENAAGAITIKTDGGASETLLLTNVKGTAAGAIDIDSTVGGITISCNAAGKDLHLDSVLGSINIEAEEGVADTILIDADGNSVSTLRLVSTTGTSVAEDGAALQLSALVGGISIQSDGDLDDAITIRADGGTTAEITIHNDQGTATDSIELISDAGGIALTGAKPVVVTGGLTHPWEVVTSTNLITINESGKTFYLASATEFVTTLPTAATSDGMILRFVIQTPPASASFTVVTDTLENLIFGSVTVNGAVIAGADEDTITFTDGAAIEGDWAELRCDGTNWYVSGQAAAATGITLTAAD